jgi:uncharacterized BrkB/YihY/UPF0761 family membrane protein/DNA-binding IscR family transcriptional regulator
MGNGLASKIRKWYTTVYEFITEKGIETHEEAHASYIERIAHFWLLVFKSFGRNRCPLRATALAYTTLLALIPLLAISFGIASSLIKERGPAETRQLISQLVDAAVPQLKLIPREEDAEATNSVGGVQQSINQGPSATNSIASTPSHPRKLTPREEAIQRIEDLVTNASSKTLGFTGMIGLIFVAILLLSTIEGTFNDIWGVTRGRTWLRRVVQYWAMISLGPIAMFSVIYLVKTQYFRSGGEFSNIEEARQLIGMDVRSGSEVLGKLQQIVTDLDGTRPACAVVSLKEDGRAKGVTFQNLVLSADEKYLRFTGDLKKLKDGPEFSRSADVSNPEFAKHVYAHFGQQRSWLDAALAKLALRASAFILISIIFALLYKMVPNTQVHVGAALMGGIMGGSLWLVLNIFTAINAGRVVNMSKIYGTALGIIPIFLIGLYFSWLIMLFGAQVAYAYQNREVYLQEKKAESVNQRNREYVALRVMTLLAQRFDFGRKPPTVLEIATELAVPSRLVGRVLQPLIDAGLVLEVACEPNEVGYAPGRPTERITCHDVLQSLRAGGGQELETRDDSTRGVVCAHFEGIEAAERQAAATLTLKDLVSEVSARGHLPDGNSPSLVPLRK